MFGKSCKRDILTSSKSKQQKLIGTLSQQRFDFRQHKQSLKGFPILFHSSESQRNVIIVKFEWD